MSNAHLLRGLSSASAVFKHKAYPRSQGGNSVTASDNGVLLSLAQLEVLGYQIVARFLPSSRSVKLIIRDIEEDLRRLVYEEPTAPLNSRLAQGGVCDYQFPANANVRLDYYRSGTDIFLQGHIEGQVVGYCARCLEPYPFDFATDFSLVLVPKEDLPPRLELTADDLDLAYYEGEEIDLSPLVDEQILLALPTRPLCDEGCLGLCPHCGKNRNLEPCECAQKQADPRWEALQRIKLNL